MLGTLGTFNLVLRNKISIRLCIFKKLTLIVLIKLVKPLHVELLKYLLIQKIFCCIISPIEKDGAHERLVCIRKNRVIAFFNRFQSCRRCKQIILERDDFCPLSEESLVHKDGSELC